MANRFSMLPKVKISRSRFDRSHSYKTTLDENYLVPFYVDEYLPGDTHKVKLSVFARLATPIVPIMDNITIDVFWFAVPNRLVWDNWQRFMGERDNPDDSIDYTVPQVSISVTPVKWTDGEQTTVELTLADDD